MIVVLGGAGFVGSHVVEHFAARGERVRVVDNNSRNQLLHTGEAALTNWEFLQGLPGVEAVEASIVDAALLSDVLEGADAIVHAAAQTAVTVSVDDPRSDFLVNAVGTFNVLEATRNVAPGAPLVFCSTNKVYGGNVNSLPVRQVGSRYAFDPPWSDGVPETLSIDLCEHSPYGASKTAADLYVQEYGHLYGLRTTVLRMSCIYGPRQWGVADQGWLAWFAKALLGGEQITIYGDGYQTRDVLYVSDLVAAVTAALEQGSPGAVFNIGGGPGYTLSLSEAIGMLQAMTNTAPTLRYADWRPSDQRIYVSDIRKAKRELGWEPVVGPEEGMKALVDWVGAATGTAAASEAGPA